MTHVLEVPFNAPRPQARSASPRLAAPRSLVVGALSSGLLAALTLPGMRAHGLGLLLVGLMVAVVVARHLPGWLTPWTAVLAGLGLVLASATVWRDAGWVVALDCLAATALAVLCVTGGRTWAELVRIAFASLRAGVRAPAFLTRPVVQQARRLPGQQVVPVIRGAALAVALTTVFAVLFSAADEAFSQLVTQAFAPTVDVGLLPVRLFILAAVATFTAGLVLLRQSVLHGPAREPGEHAPLRRVEWLLPLGALVGLFLAFVGVQLTVLYGGRTHVLETAGLTYAQYARQGFFQLLFVALLSLGVVAAAAQLVPQRTRLDRLLLRAALGALCALTVVVLVSAMTRLDTYVDAYGLTRLRVLVDTFLRWLAVVFALVIAAGLRRRAAWLPQAVIASAAGALVVLTISNPDARIARSAVERAAVAGDVDTEYLSGLSADAAPVLAASTDPVLRCMGAYAVDDARQDDSWLELNTSRRRARGLASRFEGCPRTR
jgi:hypothetical protein